MDPFLHSQLGRIEASFRRAAVWRRLAVCWCGCAVLGLLLWLLEASAKWHLPGLWLIPAAAGLISAVIILGRALQRSPDFPALAAHVERSHATARHLFSTAIEQEPDSSTGRLGFLQSRVVEELLRHPDRKFWEQELARRSARSEYAVLAALAAFIGVSAILGYDSGRQHSILASWFADDVTVTPGDVSVERGTGLVISARFSRRAPAEAALVLTPKGGTSTRLPMARHFADPIFGASISEIAGDATYHVEYGERKTADFHVRVFDYPELQRADALLVYPKYTGLTNSLIPDTRRVSAVEGTLLNYTLQLNKTVARARLVDPPRRVVLDVRSNAVALLAGFVLTNSARFNLELVDFDGRTNKAPAEFSFVVLTNRRPAVTLSFPRSDTRVSKLEELRLEARVTDDFGVLAHGIGYGIVGRQPCFVPLDVSTPPNRSFQFAYTIPLEKLGVGVGDVISYFAWADDYGPDGHVRRTLGDIYFAEVRPFEEVFRADDSGAGAASSGQRDPGTELAQFQKEIIIATWKLQQDKSEPTMP